MKKYFFLLLLVPSITLYANDSQKKEVMPVDKELISETPSTFLSSKILDNVSSEIFDGELILEVQNKFLSGMNSALSIHYNGLLEDANTYARPLLRWSLTLRSQARLNVVNVDYAIKEIAKTTSFIFGFCLGAYIAGAPVSLLGELTPYVLFHPQENLIRQVALTIAKFLDIYFLYKVGFILYRSSQLRKDLEKGALSYDLPRAHPRNKEV